VSSPFSRFFDTWPPDGEEGNHAIHAWRSVEFWVKFSADPTRLSSIKLVLSDDINNYSIYDREYNLIIQANQYLVAYFQKIFSVEEDFLWSNRNLNANIVFAGPTVADPAGRNWSLVTMEWMAIKLTDPYIINL